MKKSANWGGCYLPRSPRPSSKLRTLHILRKPNSIIVLLFLQNNSKFKNKLKHSNLGRCKHIDNASLSGLILGDQSLLRSANIFQIADVVRRVIFFCSCDVFRQYFAVNRVKFSTTVSPFCSYYQNNSTSFPGFHGQPFNNLQQGCTFDVILTSSVQYDKILSKFGQQQLVMVNYACGFKQSETGKYFD